MRLGLNLLARERMVYSRSRKYDAHFKRCYSVDETKQIEKELLQAVIDAKAEYRSDSKTHDDLIALAQDVGPERSDGGLAMRRAVLLQRAATGRYADAIKALNDFVLREKVPEFPNELNFARRRYLKEEKRFKKTLDHMSGMPLGEGGLLEALFARNVAFNSYKSALDRFADPPKQ